MTDILCTICARGGSKGVPDKNIREVGNKPLIGHAVTDAREWERDADIVVSTDSDAIASVAEEYGALVPFERPAELATDEAAKLPAIKHAVRWMESSKETQYDYVVDIDATTPMRLPGDIQDCFEPVVEDNRATNAYTVCEAEKNPYFNMVELDNEGYASLSKELDDDVVRRQDAPTVYEMNAAVYVFERDFLMDTNSIHGKYTRVSVMPRKRSIDIDTELDLRFVEFLYEHEEIDR